MWTFLKITFFVQIFDINLNKIVWKKIKNLKDSFKDFFKEYFKNISLKGITKIVKKQGGVAHAILFAFDCGGLK
jgi:hypothetical protein